MLCNKNVDIKLGANGAFLRITFIRHTQSQKIGKSNNWKIVVSKNANGPQPNSQDRLRSPIHGGGESCSTSGTTLISTCVSDLFSSIHIVTF